MPPMDPTDIVNATRAYETWLAGHMPLVRSDLRVKHQRMRESPFVFLRATFYRWMQWWPLVCPQAAEAPKVLSVGDLHLENFGTWRDAEARLNWGVNDFDEAARLPYTQDLVRLATSAALAGRDANLGISIRDTCDAILGGYVDGLSDGPSPIVLAERRRRLRQAVLDGPVDARDFWDDLLEGPRALRGAPLPLLRSRLPRGTRDLRCVRRVAGAGSLGRPRFVLLGAWGDALVAREAKRTAPSAAAWALGGPEVQRGADLLRSVVRVPDPFLSIERRWVVRRLAPDCRKVELGDFPNIKDERKLLRLMGRETANVHSGAQRGAVLRHLQRTPRRWLADATDAMLPVVVKDWQDWRRYAPDER